MAEVPFVEDDDGRLVYDLDAYHAAKAEAEPKRFIKLHGIEVPLPTAGSIPLEAMDMLQEGKVVDVLRLMFRDDFQAVRDAGLSLEDVQVIVALVIGGNPDDVLGELQASTA